METALFVGDGIENVLAPIAQLAVMFAHVLDHDVGNIGHERPVEADHAAKARRAAQDHAQHVIAAHVAGQRPIGDEERRRARVIGNDAIGHKVLFDLGIGMPRQLLRLVDQRQEQIGLVIRVDALQDRHDTLEAQAGIDVPGGQRMQFRRAGALVLNEDQIPDFQEARAVAVHAAHVTGHVLLVAILRAAIVVNLAVGTARPNLGHFPEVFLAPEEQQVRFIKARLLAPGVRGFVVARHDALLVFKARRPQAALIQTPHLGQQLPRPRDGFLLVVVAERPVAQHLEERVVRRIAAHVVQIIVLARHAHALLRIGGARIRPRAQPQEHILELHHARVGEEQGVVAHRDQRHRGHDRVALLLEELQELSADLGAGGNPPGRSRLARVRAGRRFLDGLRRGLFHRRFFRRRLLHRFGSGLGPGCLGGLLGSCGFLRHGDLNHCKC